MSKIAAELELMPGWLAGWNDMAKDQKLEAGQVVYTQPKRNKSKKPEFHLAEEGETLWGISQRFGVKLKSCQLQWCWDRRYGPSWPEGVAAEAPQVMCVSVAGLSPASR
ncbi:MAG: LysM peptidoglycan-binding domain-containing protein [Flavobacteriales bacterium]|nr:LysM peptidoglycan-binding domain-containing protein [Flavobacteriales bacterium]